MIEEEEISKKNEGQFWNLWFCLDALFVYFFFIEKSNKLFVTS